MSCEFFQNIKNSIYAKILAVFCEYMSINTYLKYPLRSILHAFIASICDHASVKMWTTVLSSAYLGRLSVMTFVIFDVVFHHEYFKSICRRILSLCIGYLNSIDFPGPMTLQGTQKQRIVVHEGCVCTIHWGWTMHTCVGSQASHWIVRWH